MVHDRDVAIAGGGTLLRNVIKAGLLDQLDLHIAPVLVGDGMRLFDPADLGLAGNEAIELTPTRVSDTPEITHIRYRVDGRSVLGGDQPG
jgi:dihydrofolate reductase